RFVADAFAGRDFEGALGRVRSGASDLLLGAHGGHFHAGDPIVGHAIGPAVTGCPGQEGRVRAGIWSFPPVSVAITTTKVGPVKIATTVARVADVPVSMVFPAASGHVIGLTGAGGN